MIRLQNVLKVSSRRICETSWRRFEDVLKTSWRCLENVLKTSWRRMEKTNILVLTKTSWRCLEAVFWRRLINKNIFVFIKTNVCWALSSLKCANQIILCFLFLSLLLLVVSIKKLNYLQSVILQDVKHQW